MSSFNEQKSSVRYEWQTSVTLSTAINGALATVQGTNTRILGVDIVTSPTADPLVVNYWVVVWYSIAPQIPLLTSEKTEQNG